ncbi:MAG: hypothetical protein H6833_08875 [Planctomycetes bacterium]|nr:hypothetical protein [Planctomycetota bacterium]
MTQRYSIALVCSWFALLLATAAHAQPGVDREKMWYAPTAEDWAKPCLITWERTWEDAVAVSRETNKAILVCINMDGEIASEHYAGVRYRMPEITKLYEPYVCVIASVYRHTPRDHDDEGHRIPCPRFGTVTCGEHIAIEPLLYEKFMEGRRIAPRHIMVELDGAETYDVFYALDTDSVFRAIREGIEKREIQEKPIVRGDRPILERVASPHVKDREAVENAYRNGDAQLRGALLDQAAQAPDHTPTELLRMALQGFDTDLARKARTTLANTNSEGSVDLISDALAVPLPTEQKDALVAALERLGKDSDVARKLAVVHKGLARTSKAVDVASWSQASAGGGTYTAASTAWADVVDRVDRRVDALEETPESPEAQLELAEASLTMAVDPRTAMNLARDRRTSSRYARLLLQDAQAYAERAERNGLDTWRVDSTLALANFYLGDVDRAYERAIRAVPKIPPGEEGWDAMATLTLFAQARQKAIRDKVAQKQEWPAEWMTDVHSAYAVLAKHPMGTAEHIVAHHDFLVELGVKGQAARVLDAGIERFPASWDLHARLRMQVFRERGLEGLEPEYERRVAKAPSANLQWFAGYASIVTADFQRRRQRFDEAYDAYGRAIAHYGAAIALDENVKENSDFYAAVAIAGRARILLERKDLDLATDEILASFQRNPRTANFVDELGITPVMTATTLKARCIEAERKDLAARIDAAFATLERVDPTLLAPPAFEREAPPAAGARGRRGRRGRGR